jgi:hypothetical protein
MRSTSTSSRGTRRRDPRRPAPRGGSPVRRRRSAPRLESLECRSLLSGPGDDFPDDLDHAALITLPADGASSQSARLETGDDVDAFRFVAPTTGDLSIRARVDEGSSLLPDWFLSDSQRQQVYFWHFSWSGTPPPYRVVAGQVYYVQVISDDAQSTGEYELSFVNRPDDFGSDSGQSSPLTVTADDFTQPARIDYPGDVDYFQFVAPLTGSMTLTHDPASGSRVATVASVFGNGPWDPIASDDPQQGTSLPGLSGIRVVEGQSYLVGVRGADGSDTGGYLLSLATRPDDWGNDFNSAGALSLSTGSTTQTGRIDYPGDVDYFQFVAPLTGSMTLTHDPASGSRVATVASVFDGDRNPVADDPSGFRVVGGRTYFLRIGGVDGSRLGRYGLAFATRPDDHGDDLDAAEQVTLSTVPTRLRGAIEFPGDVDDFRFLAPVTGMLTVEMEVAAGSGLVPSLRAFDGAGRPLGEGAAGPPGARTSRLTLAVVAGQAYGFEAAAPSGGAAGQDTGIYTLGFTLGTRETEPNETLDSAEPVAAGLTTIGMLAPGDVDLYRLTVADTGRLTARVQAPGGRTRLSLLDDGGRVLVQSDGQSPGDPGGLLRQHLAPGTYFLRVEGRGGGAGGYALITEFLAASTPFALAPTGAWSVTSFVRDVSGDGRADLVTTLDSRVEVLPGLGDGTFGPAVFIAALSNPVLMDVADIDGDGHDDLVVLEQGDLDPQTYQYVGTGVQVILGNGDGTFQPLPVRTGIDGFNSQLSLGDVDDDGRLDLVVANARGSDPASGLSTDYGVSVLLGVGDGTFRPSGRFPVAASPLAVAVGDLDGDGRLDLAIAHDGVWDDPGSGYLVEPGVDVLLGAGDGTFRPQGLLTDGDFPVSVAIADMDGDGHLDVVTIDTLNGGGAVYLRRGGGTFAPPATYHAGDSLTDFALGDLDGDRRLDLATIDFAGRVSVLIGKGDGTFRAAVPAAVEGRSQSLALGDVDGDGRLDLVVDEGGPEFGVRVLLNPGDGTFQARGRFPVENSPGAITVGDFDRDGRLDLVTANFDSGTVSVLLGNGEGTFRPSVGFPAGRSPISIASGDFNGDGRLDLAITNHGDFDYETGEWTGQGVSVLLGLGDGTFQAPVLFEAGATPWDLAVGDVNGDGHLDLVTSDGGDFSANNGYIDGLVVVLGRGDGTFGPPRRYSLGGVPSSSSSASPVIIRDVNGDGRADLVTTEKGVQDNFYRYVGDGVVVLLGRGDGTFGPPTRIPTGQSPNLLALGDVDGDGRTDAVAASSDWAGGLTILPGLEGGSFGPPNTLSFGPGSIFIPSSLVLADANGDGRPDLLMTDVFADVVGILLNEGGGRFGLLASFPGGHNVLSMAAGDFNGDGRADLATANYISADVTVFLGLGDGSFVDSAAMAIPARDTPRLADLDGDGTADVTLLDAAGRLLWRRGRPDIPGTYDPPVVLNPGTPARDFIVVATDRGPRIAAVDARGNAVSLYARRPRAPFVGPLASGFDPATYVPPRGGFVREATLPAGAAPARIIAGDLDGDGRADLAVLNATDGSVSLLRGDGHGGFTAATTLAVGLGASDLALAEVDGTGLPDLVLTNQADGEARVLPNLGAMTFGPAGRYHAGTGLYGLRRDDEQATTIATAEGTAGLAVGVFTPGGPAGLVALNRGTRSVALLAGLPGGGLANPSRIAVAGTPEQVVAADLDGDGLSDLAVLTSAGVQVLRADGAGGFVTTGIYAAGADPNGLSAADADGDGYADLLVGNGFGDVLTLVGNGDGTFRRFQPRTPAIALAVADLDGDGRDDFVFANPALERITVDYGARDVNVVGPRVVRDRSDGLLAPDAVQLADLDGDGVRDMVVANSGGNSIVVYLGLGDGRFGDPVGGASGFPVGTNPTGLSVRNVNGDGHPDLLVANTGSNDVSVLLGQGSGSSWTMIPGPRLATAGGPVATEVADLTGDGHADLAVANRQANNVQVFPGLGGGFFDDRAPLTFAAGQQPAGLFVGNFGAGTGLATINSGSDDVTVINPTTGQTQSFAAGGSRPDDGFAGDFNVDGITDLVVGNNGDGRFSLLLGGPGGLSLSQSLTSAAVPAPTSMSFAGLSGGLLSFYAAGEGREAAARLAFSVAPQGPGPAALPGEELAPSTPSPSDPTLAGAAAGVFQVASQVLGLGGSALDLVAPLITVSVIPGDSDPPVAGEAGITLLAGFQATPGSAVGQGLAREPRDDGSGGGPDDEREPPADEVDAPAPEEEPSLPPWARAAMGIDDAWQRVRSALLAKKGVDRHALGDGSKAADPSPHRATDAPPTPTPPRRHESREDARGTPPGPGPGAAASPIEGTSSRMTDAAIQEPIVEGEGGLPPRESINDTLRRLESRLTSPAAAAVVGISTAALAVWLRAQPPRSATRASARLTPPHPWDFVRDPSTSGPRKAIKTD